MNRAKNGFSQAEKDLEMAWVARNAGRHEWACLAAQQAAEKAVKALHLHLGQEAWGHVVARLLKELPLGVPQDLVERARYLDGLYIPTRYPDALPCRSFLCPQRLWSTPWRRGRPYPSRAPAWPRP
ncbi:MAG: HEPN domain-containing protein [Thermus sp.]